VRLRHHLQLLRNKPPATPLGAGQNLNLRIRTSHSHNITPNPYFKGETCPGNSGAASQASKVLADTDLISFDPDNGIEVGSVAKGRRNSSKYVYRDELAATYRSGHSLLIYQHFQRKKRESFIRDVANDLRRIAVDAEIWAIRTSHVVFMLAIQPRHRPALSAAAHHVRKIADPSFLRAELIAPGSP
jgi:hypothetical protein